MGKFRPNKLLVIDTETTGLRPFHGDRAFAFPLCDQDGNTWYREWRVDPFTRIPEVNEEDYEQLKTWLEDESLPKVFFNRKFDERMLEMIGIKIMGRADDVSIMVRVANTLEPDYKLKNLAERYLDYPKDDQTELQKEVVRCRNKGKKLGYAIAKKDDGFGTKGDNPVARDYWLPRIFDPESTHCQRYAIGDVFPRTLGLFYMFRDILEKDEYLKNTYEFEMFEVYPELYEAESRGVRVDRDLAERKMKEQTAKAEHALEQIRILSGDPNYNPRSHQRLKKLLYEELKVPVIKYTKNSRTKEWTDNPSSDQDVLKHYAHIPIIYQHLAYKSANHVNQHFLNKFVQLALFDWETCANYVLHPNFNQGNTKTLRLSCGGGGGVNFQNLESDKSAAKSFLPVQARDPIGPRPGYIWISADWAQQEIRIMGDPGCANIRNIQDAALNGRDINTENANLAWGGKDNPFALQAAAFALELGNPLLPTELVNPFIDALPGSEIAEQTTKEKIYKVWKQLGWATKLAELGPSHPKTLQAADKWLAGFDYDIVKAEGSLGKKGSRTRAKNCFYAKIYGGGPKAVKDMLYCSLEEAVLFMMQFDEIFPGIEEYSRAVQKYVYKNGFVLTRYGTKLRVNHEKAYRGVNYIIQGTAANQMKRAIVRIGNYLRRQRAKGVDAWILLSVHDELVFEIRKGHDTIKLLQRIKQIMCDSENRLSIPMEVEMSRMKTSWNDKEIIEV